MIKVQCIVAVCYCIFHQQSTDTYTYTHARSLHTDIPYININIHRHIIWKNRKLHQPEQAVVLLVWQHSSITTNTIGNKCVAAKLIATQTFWRQHTRLQNLLHVISPFIINRTEEVHIYRVGAVAVPFKTTKQHSAPVRKRFWPEISFKCDNFSLCRTDTPTVKSYHVGVFFRIYLFVSMSCPCRCAI